MADRTAIASLRRHAKNLATRSVATPGMLPRTLAVLPLAVALSGATAASAVTGGEAAPAEPVTTAHSTASPLGVDRDTDRPSRATHRRRGTVPSPNAVTRPKPKPAPAWVNPTTGYDLSSGFGHRWGTVHNGVDLAGPTGTPIRTVHSGTVERAGWYGGYGYAVIVDHGNGVSTLYGHNSRVLVKQGQRVLTGQRIALMGSTGYSTGPHLHFEVHLSDEPVDPVPWMRRHGVKL
ncbi:MAG: M23 family metallopeptidase [Micromonosporaceae bacterium]